MSLTGTGSGPFSTPPFNPGAGSNAPGGGGSSFGLPSLSTIGTLGGLGISTAGLIAGLRQAGFNKKQIKLLMKNSQALQALILPFAQQLLGFGRNPAQFLQTPQGQSMLRPLQETTARNFEGARVNLIDSLAGSGFSPSSGLAQGPLANLFSAEALAQSGNIANLISQSQNLGLQGANLLSGQQAANLPFANAFANLPNTGFQLAGAGGQLLNTLLQLQSLGRIFGTPGGCWVLTAVYGKGFTTNLLWAYWTRGWNTRLGRLYVRLYYAFGERAAAVVKRSRLLRKLLEKVFDAVFYRKALPWGFQQIGAGPVLPTEAEMTMPFTELFESVLRRSVEQWQQQLTDLELYVRRFGADRSRQENNGATDQFTESVSGG